MATTPSTSTPAPASSAFPLTTAARFHRSSACPVRPSALAEKRRTRRRRAPEGGGAGGDRSAAAGAVEKGLRLAFLEQLAERARAADAAGVADTIYDMVAAGLSPGPRSFHGLVAAHVLAGDAEGAMQSLRRELSSGVRPLHETFVALVRIFAKKGLSTRGMEILAAMERYKYDIRKAWLILVDCKAGDHSNALTVAYQMEASGRMATTFHFNCLLSVQATCGIPEVAFATFENMEYGGEDYMKPDTESYNWVIQAFTRATSYDRAADVAELLGMMVEDHKCIQPNARTYALLVECFTKYCMVNESIRHFRALRRIPGGTKVLYNEGNCGDPLSLYIRSLCLDGRPVELLDALEAMADDNQSIAPRAMILNRKYRTLVSSWIEPLQEEADLGFEIDYVARYIEEGGLTGERKRWVPRRGKTPLDPDEFGFAYSNPIETSFKQRCFEELKLYHRKLLITLRNEGPGILGDVSEDDVRRVVERLKKLVVGPKKNVAKPKAASKMVVSELKTELEAQGLPTDGTRQVLYQRVQKARRINRSRGIPLWVPPVEDEEEVDEGLYELISRIKPEDGNTEFWKRRFLGETRNYLCEEDSNEEDQDLDDELDDDEDDDDDESTKEAEEDEIDDEEAVEQTENQDGDETKDKPAKGPNQHLQMIGVQLLKDLEKTPVSSKKSKRMPEIDDDEDWFPEDPIEAFKVMREERMFDVSDMYTTADAWGWTWEREIKNKMPRKWSQEWEVELAIKIMHKVIELGGTPTIGDCAIILRAAMRAPLPSAFIPILQTTHSLGYKFGSPLYDEVFLLCLDLEEIDAAIAVVAEMETNGIKVPDETLDKVLASKKSGNSALPQPTE
ncbi:hypothetical protein PVAP13_9NG267200 [Panicum virgatum]|uniref:SAP domain-containing protein n=1 Tax=Panicum virgatum TaxID=38727 RepID=A0A8T0ML54_PANVG|nr:hypothetical protein PVAP13_9NG267200 [Panicum virgatum]